jgi:FkbM family methyltransferase
MIKFLHQISLEISFRVKSLLPGDQVWEVFGNVIHLPRSHRLPTLQKVFPKYDKYFEPIFNTLAMEYSEATFIDIGANVGDTSLAVHACAPEFQIISVEGSETFVPYLIRNLDLIKSEHIAVTRFVRCDQVVGRKYSDNGSTGGFKNTSSNSNSTMQLTTVQEILGLAKKEFKIWKSDTDGLDIPILLENLDALNKSCAVWWLEIDPSFASTDAHSVMDFARAVSQTQRSYLLFDNYGNFLSSGDHNNIEVVMAGWCTKLAEKKRRGRNDIMYLDIFTFDLASHPNLANVMNLY